MNKEIKLTTVYIPTTEELTDYHFSDKSSEKVIFSREEFNTFLEEYGKELTNKLVNEIGFIQTTSEELNSKDYQPFITDEDGQVWSINKQSITEVLPTVMEKYKI